jgi:hypothetical protein
MKKQFRTSVKGASFHTKQASNVNVVQVVLLDANWYLAYRYTSKCGSNVNSNVKVDTFPILIKNDDTRLLINSLATYIKQKLFCSNMPFCFIILRVQSTAHLTMHFGLWTALIPKALALISNCKCIARRAAKRTNSTLNKKLTIYTTGYLTRTTNQTGIRT